jgi:hypothetical protein
MIYYIYHSFTSPLYLKIDRQMKIHHEDNIWKTSFDTDTKMTTNIHTQKQFCHFTKKISLINMKHIFRLHTL